MSLRPLAGQQQSIMIKALQPLAAGITPDTNLQTQGNHTQDRNTETLPHMHPNS